METQQQTRAQLTIADRALNQSVELATTRLEQAEAQLVSGSEEAELAAIIRCQLEHRQGLVGAAAACERFMDPEYAHEQEFIQASVHSTLAYYYYREGDHTRSLTQAREAVQIAEALGDQGLLAAGNNLVGLVFSTKLLPRMALTHLEAAWEHADKVPYEELKQVVQLNLAGNYIYLGQAVGALSLLTELQNAPVVDLYPTRRLAVQSMITQAKAAMGAAAEAETELLDMLAEVGDSVLPDALTFAYHGLGIAQLARNRPDLALTSFDRVLEESGRNFETGLDHSRIQSVVVPYARALRMSGKAERAIKLLNSVIAGIPPEQPDQLLVDATDELASALTAAGDEASAMAARARSADLQKLLWDASFQYQVARLNATIETDRRLEATARAMQREDELQTAAERETALKYQYWLTSAMLIALILALHSRRLQKQLANTERAANEKLEEQVRQRTRDLEDEMAERLRAEAEQRDLRDRLSEVEKMRVMGQLTAGVAHDFNNLMTVVTLATEHVQNNLRTADDDANAEILDSVLSAADSGNKITDGLLAYVRKQPLNPKLLQLDEHIQASLPLFRQTLGERLSLETEVAPCAALVDKGQLTTALLNLLLNAKEAMPDSGTLYLRLKNTGTTAELSVCDAGTGMTQDTVQRAFEPFFTTKASGEGTGLGLSMVYGFARQSGGDLAIVSEEGLGTTVTLTLPLAKGKTAQEKPAQPLKSKRVETRRVLVVDDRDTLLAMLERMLQQLGFDTRSANNADQALEIVQSSGMPDLLLSDILMPGSMDGLALAERLRAQHSGLAVVLISGYTDQSSNDYVFLQKPFSIMELEQSIKEALDEVSSVPA